MMDTKKNLLVIFLFIYFLIGAFYSLNTGLSHDEYHEQRNWEYNLALVNYILFNVEIEPTLINYQDKYYGIGFQIISQPIQFILKNIILKFQSIDPYGAHLLAKHFVVFTSFFISVIFVYLIISKIINNFYFSISATFLYSTYPYLLGHGLFNPKDIPFLCFWIICTYVSINIFTKLLRDTSLKYQDIILISLLSAFLLSIRITGALIFIQYLVTFVIFINLKKIKFINFFRIYFIKILGFIFLTTFLTYLFYPVFWRNPLLIFEAINFMSSHFNNVCTLTLGKCMFSNNLDPTYIPIWILVKLPLIILIGLLLLPITERKIFTNERNNIFFGTLLISSFLIPIILIFKKVHLYDELRQVLFIIPSIFILGVISIYIYSKKIFYFLSFITLIIFLAENVIIYPYQYVWFNTPSRVLNLTKNFELDYWGLSGKDLAKKTEILNKSEITKPCVVVSPDYLVKPFLNPNLFTCFIPWSAIDTDISRPFWAIQNVRNLKKGRSYKCDTVYESKFNFLFSKEDIITGRLIKCT